MNEESGTITKAGDAVPPVPSTGAVSTLSLGRLAKRVELVNTLVLSQLHTIQQKRVQDEEARGVRLETKASGLIGVNALTLTLVSSVGIGVMLQTGAALGVWLAVVLPLYLGCVGLGLWTGWLALEAVKVRDHHKLTDDDIFPEDVLKDAEAVGSPDNAGDREKNGLGLYHRYGIMCLSKLLTKEASVNDRKAADLEKAQRRFQWFLGAVGLLALAAAVIVVVKAVAR